MTAADRERARQRAAVDYVRAGASGSALRILDELIATTDGAGGRLALETERLAVRIWAGDLDLDGDAVRALAVRLGPEAPVEVARLLTTLAIGLVIVGRGPEAGEDARAARALVAAGVDVELDLACDVVDLHLGGPGGDVLSGRWSERLTDAELAMPSLVTMAATSALIWADDPARAEHLLDRSSACCAGWGRWGRWASPRGWRPPSPSVVATGRTPRPGTPPPSTCAPTPTCTARCLTSSSAAPTS